MADVRFAVVGIVGYARTHLKTLMELEEAAEGVRLEAVVAKFPEEDPQFVEALKSRGVTIYDDLDALFSDAKGSVDVVTLPTSIPSHAPLSVAAMEAGFHVLCEKPPAATVQEVDRMIAAGRKTGKHCSIGFQDIHGPSIQRLKSMLLSGALGDVHDAACRGIWPRPSSYYQRNRWAGRYKVNEDYILDGPMNNALAHFLHAMLYLTGETAKACAEPQSVQAEMYRARPDIDGDDTGCLRLRTTSGIDIHFIVSHAAARTAEPIIELRTSKATVHWARSGETVITYKDGSVERFDNEGTTGRLELFRDMARVVRGEREEPIGKVDYTRPFVVAINGAHESSKAIHPVPKEYVEVRSSDKGDQYVIQEIHEISQKAFDERRLFAELDVAWAVAAEPFLLDGYAAFPVHAAR